MLKHFNFSKGKIIHFSKKVTIELKNDVNLQILSCVVSFLFHGLEFDTQRHVAGVSFPHSLDEF